MDHERGRPHRRQQLVDVGLRRRAEHASPTAGLAAVRNDSAGRRPASPDSPAQPRVRRRLGEEVPVLRRPGRAAPGSGPGLIASRIRAAPPNRTIRVTRRGWAAAKAIAVAPSGSSRAGRAVQVGGGQHGVQVAKMRVDPEVVEIDPTVRGCPCRVRRRGPPSSNGRAPRTPVACDGIRHCANRLLSDGSQTTGGPWPKTW